MGPGYNSFSPSKEKCGWPVWTFPCQPCFLPKSRPCSHWCVLAPPGHHSSSLQSLPWGHHATFAPLSSSNSWAITLWFKKKKFRGPSIRHSTLFPKRKTLPVLHISFWSSWRLSGRVTRAYCFLVPPKLFDFSFGFFYQREAFERLPVFLASLSFDQKAFFPQQSLPVLFCL